MIEVNRDLLIEAQKLRDGEDGDRPPTPFSDLLDNVKPEFGILKPNDSVFLALAVILNTDANVLWIKESGGIPGCGKGTISGEQLARLVYNLQRLKIDPKKTVGITPISTVMAQTRETILPSHLMPGFYSKEHYAVIDNVTEMSVAQGLEEKRVRILEAPGKMRGGKTIIHGLTGSGRFKSFDLVTIWERVVGKNLLTQAIVNRFETAQASIDRAVFGGGGKMGILKALLDVCQELYPLSFLIRHPNKNVNSPLSFFIDLRLTADYLAKLEPEYFFNNYLRAFIDPLGHSFPKPEQLGVMDLDHLPVIEGYSSPYRDLLEDYDDLREKVHSLRKPFGEPFIMDLDCLRELLSWNLRSLPPAA